MLKVRLSEDKFLKILSIFLYSFGLSDDQFITENVTKKRDFHF